MKLLFWHERGAPCSPARGHWWQRRRSADTGSSEAHSTSSQTPRSRCLRFGKAPGAGHPCCSPSEGSRQTRCPFKGPLPSAQGTEGVGDVCTGKWPHHLRSILQVATRIHRGCLGHTVFGHTVCLQLGHQHSLESLQKAAGHCEAQLALVL